MSSTHAGRPGGAGPALRTAVVTAALAVLLVSALAVPLGAAGLWHPVLVWPLVVVALVAALLVARRLPDDAHLGTLPALALVGVVLVVTVWLGATHADQALPRRDAGSNLQAAVSLATEHRRVVPVDLEAVGGARTLERPGLDVDSPAFYRVGDAEGAAVQPQFPVGTAAVLSLGWWAGGATGAQLLGPLALGLVLLGLGLLAARWAHAWTAPVVAALAGGAFPLVHTGRSTYSEPFALLTLVAGLLLLAGASAAAPARAGGGVRRTALLAGVLVGGTALVRADALREVVLATVFAGLLLLRRRTAVAGPLLVGLWGSTVVAFAALLWLSPRYLGDIAASLVPLVALAVAVLLAVAGAYGLARRGARLPRRLSAVLPVTTLVGTLAGGALLWSRPFWQVVRQSAADPGAKVVAGLQARQGLPVDGGRTYAEQTVAWLTWWVGPVALGTALVVLALLLRRVALAWTGGTQLPDWTGPLLVAAGSTVLTLARPGITPDHPWAERRLVIAVPLVLVLAVVGADGLLARGARRWSPLVGALSAAFVLVATAIPVARGTAPHAGERVEAGSSVTVAAVCSALRPGDVVVAVDSRAVNEWPQVIRGSCGRPALSTRAWLRRDPAALRSTLSAVAADLPPGSRLVLAAAEGPAALAALGPATAVRAVGVRTVREDQRLLEEIPTSTDALTVGLWLAPLP